MAFMPPLQGEHMQHMPLAFLTPLASNDMKHSGTVDVLLAERRSEALAERSSDA
jgi:hypothetical protein